MKLKPPFDSTRIIPAAPGNRSLPTWLARFAALSIVLVAASTTQTVSAQSGIHCTRTSDRAALACKFESKDDYWIEMANCKNIGDSGDRSECWDDARERPGNG